MAAAAVPAPRAPSVACGRGERQARAAVPRAHVTAGRLSARATEPAGLGPGLVIAAPGVAGYVALFQPALLALTLA